MPSPFVAVLLGCAAALAVAVNMVLAGLFDARVGALLRRAIITCPSWLSDPAVCGPLLRESNGALLAAAARMLVMEAAILVAAATAVFVGVLVVRARQRRAAASLLP